jgi:YbgC/YbaW family acyl-CoA thioester hydrolase
LAAENFLFVVHSCAVRYHRPARVDDALEVTAELQHLGKASLDFIQQVWRGDELLCQADVRVACVSADGVKPRALPVEIYNKLNNI